MIKNFIMNHGMRLSMFNEYSDLKFLAVADTRFASHIVMLKRFLLLKESLVLMMSLLLHVPTCKMPNLLDTCKTYIEYIEEASYCRITM
jgi:hypothetical protein